MTRNAWKKICALFLAVIMTVSLISVYAFAEEPGGPGQTETEEMQLLGEETAPAEGKETAAEPEETAAPAEALESADAESGRAEEALEEEIPPAAEEQGTEAETEEEAAAEEPETDITQEEQTQPAAEEQEERTGPEEETEAVAPGEETTEIEAASAAVIEYGTCGADMTWVLDEDGVLTISGTGDMESMPGIFTNRRLVKEIVIEEGVTSIISDAFGDYYSYVYQNLTKVTLPDSLTVIGDGAFSSSSVEEVVGGAGLKEIGAYAFSHCGSLQSFPFHDGITRIGEWAFFYCALSTVHIPSTLKSIEKNTFALNNISSVEIPDSVEYIGENAFGQCGSLSAVSLGDGVTSIGKSGFYRCVNLTDIEFGTSLEEIGEKAFAECSTLENIVIPDTVVTIGSCAFDDCTALTAITIGSGVQSLPGFSKCPALEQIIFSPDNPYFNDGNGCNVVVETATGILIAACKTSQIPEGITAISGGAFQGWQGTELVIPGSIRSIGNGAFRDAAIVSIVLGEGVQEIGQHAFSGCSGLSEVAVPDSVTSLGRYAFADCTGLLKAKVGSGVKVLERCTFMGCTSLAELTLSEGLETIEEEAAIDCPSLKEIAIPSSVTKICDAAFGFTMYEYNEMGDINYIPVEGFNILGGIGSAAHRYAVGSKHLFNGELIHYNIAYFITNIQTIPEQVYTGEAIEPEIELIMPAYTETEVEVALAKDEDFTVEYKNNTRVGIAEVTVEGKGEYHGERTAKFQICFTDVPTSHPYQKAIYWSLENGIAKGFSDGHFGVGESITRGQFILMLWRIAGKPEPSGQKKTFKDVPVTSSMFKAVQWAAENRITTGYTKGAKKGYFGINDPITRGQLMMFLWRYMERPAVSGTPKEFSDVPPAHSYYQAIQWASAANITSGKNGAFLVGDCCTRGQCAKFLYQLFR